MSDKQPTPLPKPAYQQPIQLNIKVSPEAAEAMRENMRNALRPVAEAMAKGFWRDPAPSFFCTEPEPPEYVFRYWWELAAVAFGVATLLFWASLYLWPIRPDQFGIPPLSPW